MSIDQHMEALHTGTPQEKAAALLALDHELAEMPEECQLALDMDGLQQEMAQALQDPAVMQALEQQLSSIPEPNGETATAQDTKQDGPPLDLILAAVSLGGMALTLDWMVRGKDSLVDNTLTEVDKAVREVTTDTNYTPLEEYLQNAGIDLDDLDAAQMRLINNQYDAYLNGASIHQIAGTLEREAEGVKIALPAADSTVEFGWWNWSTGDDSITDKTMEAFQNAMEFAGLEENQVEDFVDRLSQFWIHDGRHNFQIEEAAKAAGYKGDLDTFSEQFFRVIPKQDYEIVQAKIRDLYLAQGETPNTMEALAEEYDVNLPEAVLGTIESPTEGLALLADAASDMVR